MNFDCKKLDFTDNVCVTMAFDLARSSVWGSMWEKGNIFAEFVGGGQYFHQVWKLAIHLSVVTSCCGFCMSSYYTVLILYDCNIMLGE